MTKLLWAVVFAVGSLPAMAADVDVFGGYSILNTDSPTGSGRDTFNGWQASAATYFNSHFGIAGDFGGHYKTYSTLGAPDLTLKSFEYLFGPQVRMQAKKVTPFAHVLIGGLRQSADAGSLGSATANSFMLGLGGGVDVDVHKNLAIRLVQIDWLPAHSGGAWATDAVRLGFGVVFKLGR